MVWDDTTGAPAALGGGALKARSEGRARSACDILKRIYRNRLEATSARRSNERAASAVEAGSVLFPGRQP